MSVTLEARSCYLLLSLGLSYSSFSLKVKVFFRNKVDLSPGQKETYAGDDHDCNMNSDKIVRLRKTTLLLKTKLGISLKGTLYIS